MAESAHAQQILDADHPMAATLLVPRQRTISKYNTQCGHNGALTISEKYLGFLCDGSVLSIKHLRRVCVFNEYCHQGFKHHVIFLTAKSVLHFYGVPDVQKQVSIGPDDPGANKVVRSFAISIRHKQYP